MFFNGLCIRHTFCSRALLPVSPGCCVTQEGQEADGTPNVLAEEHLLNVWARGAGSWPGSSRPPGHAVSFALFFRSREGGVSGPRSPGER